MKVYGSLLLLFSTLSRSRLVSMQVQSHFSFQSPFVLFVVMPKQPPSAAAAVCRHSFSVSPQRQASGLCQEVWCGIEGKQLTIKRLGSIVSNDGAAARSCAPRTQRPLFDHQYRPLLRVLPGRPEPMRCPPRDPLEDQ